MAILANRAWVSTATAGTGTITLGSALSGYQSFADAGITNGQVVRYTIIDGANWEIGTGTYTSAGTTLSRTPSESTNADAAINLSGSATVFIAAAAADIIHTDVANTWTAVQGYAETSVTMHASGTSTWDVSTAPVALFDLSTSSASGGNTQMAAPSNVTAGRIYTARITQGSPARTISWASNFRWQGGSANAPVLSTTQGAIHHLTFRGRASNVLEEIGRSLEVATS